MRAFRFLLALLAICAVLSADENLSDDLQNRYSAQISELKTQIEAIDEKLKDDVWLIKFSNFLNYHELENSLNELEKKVEITKDKDEISDLEKRIQTIK